MMFSFFSNFSYVFKIDFPQRVEWFLEYSTCYWNCSFSRGTTPTCWHDGRAAVIVSRSTRDVQKMDRRCWKCFEIGISERYQRWFDGTADDPVQGLAMICIFFRISEQIFPKLCSWLGWNNVILYQACNFFVLLDCIMSATLFQFLFCIIPMITTI